MPNLRVRTELTMLADGLAIEIRDGNGAVFWREDRNRTRMMLIEWHQVDNLLSIALIATDHNPRVRVHQLVPVVGVGNESPLWYGYIVEPRAPCHLCAARGRARSSTRKIDEP